MARTGGPGGLLHPHGIQALCADQDPGLHNRRGAKSRVSFEKCQGDIVCEETDIIPSRDLTAVLRLPLKEAVFPYAMSEVLPLTETLVSFSLGSPNASRSPPLARLTSEAFCCGAWRTIRSCMA